MPLPKPKDGEAKDAFVARCMAAQVMNDDFPKAGQRYAVCVRLFTGGTLDHGDMPKDMPDHPAHP